MVAAAKLAARKEKVSLCCSCCTTDILIILSHITQNTYQSYFQENKRREKMAEKLKLQKDEEVENKRLQEEEEVRVV